MPPTSIIHVPHLGGITASYRLSQPYNAKLPTLVLINSFTTSSALYDNAFSTPALTSTMNLLAIELLGHGGTRAHKTDNWTYWDTAIMNLQVMEKLGVERAFVLGTSQGGWVTVRMALLRGDKIQGIIPLGTSLDSESPRSRDLGCWHAVEPLAERITGEFGPSAAGDGFAPSKDFVDFLVDVGFGKACPEDVRRFWEQEIKRNYQGEEGRKRIRMAAINLRDRDGLHLRLEDVRCPVLWLHGTDDAVYSVANAKEEIQLFTNSPEARLEVIQGGQHFLSASNPKEVNEHVVAFVNKYNKAGPLL
ncbi:Alpha/beta hydrolase fold family protein [Pyrenophora tritici-repentis]|nr:Alpha/beta hydrolase fold family protein [Pyrenophora tritici-repentis]